MIKKYIKLNKKYVIGKTIDIKEYDSEEYIRCPFCNKKLIIKFLLKAVQMPNHCPNCGGKINSIDSSEQKRRRGGIGWQI